MWVAFSFGNCNVYFYRAMRFSAISCRLSVRLSVWVTWCWWIVITHVGWNSSEIIPPLVSLGCLLSADANIKGLLQGKHPEILAQSDPPPVDLSVGDIRSQTAAEWLQRAQRSQWRAYRKPVQSRFAETRFAETRFAETLTLTLTLNPNPKP